MDEDKLNAWYWPEEQPEEEIEEEEDRPIGAYWCGHNDRYEAAVQFLLWYRPDDSRPVFDQVNGFLPGRLPSLLSTHRHLHRGKFGRLW